MTNYQTQLEHLVLYPQESLGVEIKQWLDLTTGEHKADLAKAILALANHGGGYVVVGFAEVGNSFIPDTNRPADLREYNQDDINGIVRRFAHPPFHCAVYHVAHPTSQDDYPIIAVPGDHRTPIRSRRAGPNGAHVQDNVYYTRVAGPQSAPIQSPQDWDAVISRCTRANRQDLVDTLRQMILGGALEQSPTMDQRFIAWIDECDSRFDSLLSSELREETPSRYSNGTWTVAYSIPCHRDTPSLAEFERTLRRVEGRESGWPVWLFLDREGLSPYPYAGHVECWLKDTKTNDAAHSDFWRASPAGDLFLKRGYQEDSIQRLEPGSTLGVSIPIYRICECLLHAERLRTAIGEGDEPIRFRSTWTGLSGRRLVSLDDPLRDIRPHQAKQDVATSSVVVEKQNIADSLHELVESITRPLFECFEFFELPSDLIVETIAELRKRG